MKISFKIFLNYLKKIYYIRMREKGERFKAIGVMRETDMLYR